MQLITGRDDDLRQLPPLRPAAVGAGWRQDRDGLDEHQSEASAFLAYQQGRGENPLRSAALTAGLDGDTA